MNKIMSCDLETGVCGAAGESTMEAIELDNPKAWLDLYYVTDPICCHCWAIEPVLRRFTAQYGHYFKFHIIMGGLLESWEGFADVSNRISGPADVASHWREVGEHSRMPIDGSLWIKNPIKSSYPPSRVYKIIQQQDDQLAKVFLRRAREAVFVFNQNIGEDVVLIEIVNQLGLAGEEIVKQASRPDGQQLLQQDFALAGRLGVRGFPTIIMLNTDNKGIKVIGARPLKDYINALKQVLPIKEELQPHVHPTLKKLLEKEHRLFAKEIEVMYELEKDQVQAFIKKELSPGEYILKEILGEIVVECLKG